MEALFSAMLEGGKARSNSQPTAHSAGEIDLMTEWTIHGAISVQRAMQEAGQEVMRLIDSGPVEIIVQTHDEKSSEKRRSTRQNRLIYSLYQRIGKTLYGNDELHARRECKLRIGCRILYRDKKEFAELFDRVIRNLDHETRLNSMDLVSVSSIMSVKQVQEYTSRIISTYSEQGCYFLDLDILEHK